MITYSLTLDAKKEIIKDLRLNIILTQLLKDCGDVQFFGIILDEVNKFN